MAEEIHGDVDFEKVSKSRARALLGDFDGGPTRYGGIVTGMVGELVRKPWWPTLTVLTMRYGDRTAGVCAWFPRPLPDPDGPMPEDDTYIHTIGLSRDFQGKKLSDGAWLSNALLRGALRQIATDAADGQMPSSWTCVAPFNKKSHRLFRQHGYGTRRPQPGCDIIRFRPSFDPDLYLKE
jgi:hypothetical protein